MSEPIHSPSALEGSHVGNYVVEGMIGKGGMGEVYLARHPDLGREVAIKILTGRLAADATAIGRFRQEAMAACRIGHDAIVEILDIGQLADGRHYYVMEHLQGQSLHDYLEGAGAISPRLCLEILQPVVAALSAAHAVGIVHRDIKPDNVFLAQNRDGSLRVKVLDFGIAKLVDSTVPPLVATRTGALIGTPLYMSPEQCAGNGDIGPAVDIYAVGAMAFTMLTGRPPFLGEGMGEVLVQHMQAAPPSVRDFRPELDDSLDQVLHCALAKQPAERFHNVAALGAALETAITGTTPTNPAGGLTVRLLDSAVPAPLISPQSYETTAAQRPLSQTSLSAAASEHVPLPAPTYVPPPNPNVYRILVIAVVVGLLIGVGAVTAGIYLGRSRTSGPAASGTTKSAAFVRPSPDAGAPHRTSPAPPNVQPAPIPIVLPPPTQASPIPLVQPPAAAAPPGNDPGPIKPNRMQLKMGRDWLVEAQRQMDEGQYLGAIIQARMSYKYLKSTAAIRIIGHCACLVAIKGYLPYARWAYKLLSKKDRSSLKATCAIRKIPLP
jgi:eukaryotic-like serine/threonine-protein kinase